MIRPAISFILAISPLLITPEIPWSKSKSGGGVIVYTRPVVGSDIKEIKATFELSCSLNSAVACVPTSPIIQSGFMPPVNQGY